MIDITSKQKLSELHHVLFPLQPLPRVPWKRKWKWKLLSCVRLFVTPWTIPSMEFSRPKHWVGSLSLLHGIFPTQGSNPGLLHCRQILYQLSHKGNPRILEWVAYRFSSGSSWPKNWTGVSCIAVGFFTNWSTLAREYSFSQRSKVKNVE